jgi:hypothetical protein
MIIYNTDFDERLNLLRQNQAYINEINNSLVDHRDLYRNFSSELSISQESILECCDSYQRTLLIDCFTFSEQLVKSFIYHLIDKGNYTNNFLKYFINNKVPEDRFSPNVKFSAIQNNIKSQISTDFKFILNSNNDYIKTYDEMVKARHSYAHSGSYTFNLSHYSDVIKALEYIHFELGKIIELGHAEHQIIFKKIRNLSKDIKKNEITRNNNRFLLSDIKVQSINFIERFGYEAKSIPVLNDIIISLEEITLMDLRNFNMCKRKVISFYSLIE